MARAFVSDIAGVVLIQPIRLPEPFVEPMLDEPAFLRVFGLRGRSLHVFIKRVESHHAYLRIGRKQADCHTNG